MANANPWGASGAVEFVETAARRRAASYRERAEHLSALAHTEPISKLRAQLLYLAGQYEDLAESLISPSG
jgi:hypothetical protein